MEVQTSVFVWWEEVLFRAIIDLPPSFYAVRLMERTKARQAHETWTPAYATDETKLSDLFRDPSLHKDSRTLERYVLENFSGGRRLRRAQSRALARKTFAKLRRNWPEGSQVYFAVGAKES